MSQPLELSAALPAAPAGAARATPLVVRRSDSERQSFFAELATAVREVWESRGLLYQLVLRDVRVRYKQAVFGLVWAVLMPMIIVLSGTLIRIAMATASGRGISAAVIGATAVKGVTWAFFSGALGSATGSLLTNKSLFTKLSFPREVLPLATVGAQAVDTGIGVTALAVLLPFLGLNVSPAVLWVPALVVLHLLLTIAAGLFVACANLFFRDVKYIVQVILTFGIFLTPVFFEPVMLGPVIGRLMMLNPVSPIIEGMRLSVIEGHNLLVPLVETTRRGVQVLAWSPWYLAYSAAWAVLGLVGSMRLFRRSAVLFAEYA